MMEAKQLFLCFLVVTVIVGCFGCGKTKKDDDKNDINDNCNCDCKKEDFCSRKGQNSSEVEITRCGFCGCPITIYMKVENSHNGAITIPQEVNVTAPRRELIFFLQSAADSHPAFKFSADYFAGLGYFISKINGTAGSTEDRTYWQIVDSTTNTPLNLGVSSYVPENGEQVVFRFTGY